MRVGVRGGARERNAWRGVLETDILQAFLAFGLAQYSRKPSNEPTLQKTRLSHQPTGACGLEVASSALCPFLAVQERLALSEALS